MKSDGNRTFKIGQIPLEEIENAKEVNDETVQWMVLRPIYKHKEIKSRDDKDILENNFDLIAITLM